MYECLLEEVTDFFCNFFVSGRHFCLKCLITSGEAKVPPCDRATKPRLRSLQSLADDLEQFTAAGADLDNAKLFNNVISPAFFDIPLDQVGVKINPMTTNSCFPGKQITLVCQFEHFLLLCWFFRSLMPACTSAWVLAFVFLSCLSMISS